MSDDSNLKEKLRQRLNELLKRVPPKVNSGSVQVAVNFKRFHASATKVVSSQRSTAQQLQSALNQADAFYV
jgi:hypothetical protein